MKIIVAFLIFLNAPKPDHICALNALSIRVFLPDYIHVSVVLIGNHQEKKHSEELGWYGKKMLKYVLHE